MIYILLALLVILLIWADQTKKDIQIASIQGFMIGALYDCFEEDEEKYYTIQVLLGVLSINIYW
jgi:uncharacterized membrane protein YoaK (UPF0700 family)